MNKESNIPKFSDGLKKSPFSVPHGYFDELPSRIQEKCVVPDKAKKSWIRALAPQLGFVVGFVVLVLIAKGFFGIIGQTPHNPQPDSVAQAIDTTIYHDENGEPFFDEDMVIDDAIISYLVDNNINDLDIVQ